MKERDIDRQNELTVGYEIMAALKRYYEDLFRCSEGSTAVIQYENGQKFLIQVNVTELKAPE